MGIITGREFFYAGNPNFWTRSDTPKVVKEVSQGPSNTWLEISNRKYGRGVRRREGLDASPELPITFAAHVCYEQLDAYTRYTNRGTEMCGSRTNVYSAVVSHTSSPVAGIYESWLCLLVRVLSVRCGPAVRPRIITRDPIVTDVVCINVVYLMIESDFQC